MRSRSLSKEEEEEMENLRAARVRSNAFYGGEAGSPPPPVKPKAPKNDPPSYSSSGIVRPTKRPKVAKEGKLRCESSRFKVGYADTIGRRPRMEDELVIIGHFRGKDEEDYIGLFDGHGGRAASSYCADRLHVIAVLSEYVFREE